MQTRLQHLDTWRAIAVAMVISSHLNHALAGFGEVGVFVFFFLSGFVVSRAALEEARSTGSFSPAAFYVRRIFRIIPPLVLYLATCAALAFTGVIAADLRQLVSGALYVCNVSLANCGWYAGHTWSLAFEEQFYLLFPLLFVLPQKRTPMLAAWAALACLLALPALISPVHFVGRSGFVMTYALFGLGYLAAKLEGRIAFTRWSTIVLLLSAAITFFPLDFVFPAAPWGTFYKFVYLASIPVMVLASGRSEFSAVFNVGWIVLIGRASYSVYLWQQLFTSPAFGISIWTRGVLIVAMCCACVALFFWIEAPTIRIGRRLGASISESAPNRSSGSHQVLPSRNSR